MLSVFSWRFRSMTPTRLLRISRHRVRSVARSGQLDAELRREVSFHFDQLVAEFTADGMPPDEARSAAHRTLGNIALMEARCRDQRRTTWLHDFWQDLVHGLGLVRRHRGFTAIAVASLALGIGANIAVLGVIDALLLGGLPFPDQDRLVVIRTFPLDNPQQTNNASAADYVAWKERSRSFEAIGASLADQKDLGSETAGGIAERLSGQGFAPDVFRALGVQPILGRLFTDAESRAGNLAPVVVISHPFWQRRFGGNPAILGTRVRMNGAPTTIIGVMPPAFRFPNDGIDFWGPLPVSRFQPQDSARFFMVTARLKPGVTAQQAERDVAAINAQLTREFPDGHEGRGVRVQPLHDALLGWTRQPLRTLEAAVALVLLIACANVAGLLLARGSVRRSEFAVRMALGAGRGRIVRQLLTEGLLLSLIGGLLGVVVAGWGLRILIAMWPPPGGLRIPEVGLNARMILNVAVLSGLTGLLFGLAPALAAFRLNLTGSLNESVRGTGTQAGGHRLRGALVASQIALALVLLIGTGLLLNSVLRLAGRELNFDPEGLLTFEVRVPATDPTAADRPSILVERIYDRLRGLPGAESVAGISFPPVNSLLVPTMVVNVEGRPAPKRDADRVAASAKYFLVTPSFFATMKAPIVHGRDFEAGDAASARWVSVINETAARRFWPGGDPIGKRFTLDVEAGERTREVIGVVRDIPLRSAYVDVEPVIYTSFLQQSREYRGPFANMFGQMTFLLRSAGDPMTLLPAARSAVAQLDRNRAVARIMPMNWYIVGGWRNRGAYALVLGAFAFTATLLAAVGIYGVMAYAVAQRTREIGIRMALGASAREVVALVGRRALLLIAAGLVLGVAGSVAFARLLGSELWGVTPTDPLTFGAVSLLLVVVALVACVVPVRRAVKVDPTVALRYE